MPFITVEIKIDFEVRSAQENLNYDIVVSLYTLGYFIIENVKVLWYFSTLGVLFVYQNYFLIKIIKFFL